MSNYVKLNKDHVAGFGKGHILKTTAKNCARLLEANYGTEVEESEYLDFRKKEGAHRKDFINRSRDAAENEIKNAKAKLKKD